MSSFKTAFNFWFVRENEPTIAYFTPQNRVSKKSYFLNEISLREVKIEGDYNQLPLTQTLQLYKLIARVLCYNYSHHLIWKLKNFQNQIEEEKNNSIEYEEILKKNWEELTDLEKDRVREIVSQT